MNERPPRIVGAYRVLDYIAEGGMAHVFRAIDKSQNLEVALKVLKPEGERLVQHLTSLNAPWEGQIGVQFDHPNVMHAFEHGPWKDTHYVAMELLDWSPLMLLITTGSPLVEAHGYAILYQIATGLAYIHDRGFIHRDLCPKNVLIDSQGSPKIIDFSLTVPSQMAASSRDKRSGTPSYMAPEQIRAKSFDARSDIYAFGITMYEVLTGKHPFRSTSKERQMAAHLNVQAPPPSRHEPSIAPAVDELILRAMAKDPEDRFPNMTPVVAAVRKSFPPGAVTDEPVMKAGPKARRFVRVDIECFVRLRVGRVMKFFREFRTVTKNLSLDGACCVSLRRAMSEGQRVDMDLQLLGDPTALPVKGEVAWCRKSPEDGTYEIGIAFRAMSAAARDKLRQYVLAHRGMATS